MPSSGVGISHLDLRVKSSSLLETVCILPTGSFALGEMPTLAGGSTESLSERLVDAKDFESSTTIDTTRELSSVAVLAFLFFSLIGSGLDAELEEGLELTIFEPDALPCDLAPSFCASVPAVILLVLGLAKNPLALLPLRPSARDTEGFLRLLSGESKLESVVMRA